jgi:hypothetical protein
MRRPWSVKWNSNKTASSITQQRLNLKTIFLFAFVPARLREHILNGISKKGHRGE